jgi:flavin reductase (DIM6/NTAB) family NADH-FMN oxidoreductase RutF
MPGTPSDPRRVPWSLPTMAPSGPRHAMDIPLPAAQAGAPEFRDAMGAFPAAVCVVTALDDEGIPRGLTCSAQCSVSMDPPCMLICVNRKNRSLDAIRHSQGFLVNLLRAGRYELSDLFASASPDKFAEAQWSPSPASGLPLLSADTLAFVDCALCTEIHAGSHAVLIGLVRGSGAAEPADGPLVYWRRSYGQWSPFVPVRNFAEMPEMPEIYA